MTDNVHLTREAWLTAAYLGLKPLFIRVGHPLIQPVRLSMGFPSSGGLATGRRRVGECWGSEASAGGFSEIFISPLLDQEVDVLATVAHELGHTVLGSEVGHKRPFAVLMKLLGLEGKPASTVSGPRFRENVVGLLDELGPLPHQRLVPVTKEKKEKVALYRCVCPRCGYTARVIRRWLAASGPPLCPTDLVLLKEG